MKKYKAYLSRILPQIIIIVMILCALLFIAPSFFSKSNISNILVQQLPYMLIPSFSMMLSVILGDLDLSIGANIAFSSCVCGILCKQIGYVPGVLIAIVSGSMLGAINGVLISKVKLPAFITTYGMNWVITGATTVIMMGSTVYSFSDSFRNIIIGATYGIPNSIIFTVVIIAALGFILNRTVFGRNIYSYGFNQTATHYAGAQTEKNVILIYSIAGFLAALTGIMYLARLDAADSTLSEGWNIKLIASVLVGGASMSGGRAWVTNTVLGAFIMVLINNVLNLLNVSSLWQQFVIGMVILASVLVKTLNFKKGKERK